MREKIESLLAQIKKAEADPQKGCTLPQNAYYLSENEILCRDREFGVSRFPYVSDGLVLWAYSNGIIEACESTFHIFKPLHYSEEPSVNFFGGIKKADGSYRPVALFENSRQLVETEKIDRYVVYSNCCVYYIADTDSVTFALRIHTDEKKHMHFSFNAFNKTDAVVPIYMFSFFDALLRYCESDNFWDRMHKYAEEHEHAYLLRSFWDYLVVNRKAYGEGILRNDRTVGKTDIFGNRKSIINSGVLTAGAFPRRSNRVNTTNLPVAADLFEVGLQAGGDVRCEFDLSYYHDRSEAVAGLSDDIDIRKIDALLDSATNEERREFDNLKIRFGDWKGNLHVELLNKFLHTVQKQVSVCALGKNYAGSLIGIRDVMQQLDGSLMWQPEKSRAKIINTLNYVLEDGRAPRQFSIPTSPRMMPQMDLHEYIDQGVWIISTVYAYLAFTGDYSILDETCSYYVPNEENTKIIRKSDICDTVLDHLLKIMAFLSSNLDTDYGTGCLRALVGDWNDAIDALGNTDDKGKKFGSGVSVMVTLQFYQNCDEMAQILSAIGKYPEKVEEYKHHRETVRAGLLKYAVDRNADGEKRILHGWGDKYSYKIGSFHDPDGVARISSIANAFWALSGMIKEDLSFKSVIDRDINKLVSKYGLLTFDKPFMPDMQKYVGRISGITEGTYENAASYVHAALFAGCALFAIGEGKRAWEELEHSATISHENCSMTPFVMPNSYCYNPAFCIDGESMGDWYTGSGTVLIKEVVRYGFGILPDLAGLHVTTPKYMHCTHAELEMRIKGKPIKVTYQNAGGQNRVYLVDDAVYPATYDEAADTMTIFIPNEKIHDGMTIRIIDG